MQENFVNPEPQQMTQEVSDALGNPLYIMAVDEHNCVTFWSRPDATVNEDFEVNHPPQFPKGDVTSLLHVEAESRYCYCKNGKKYCCKMVDGIEVCWKTDQNC